MKPTCSLVRTALSVLVLAAAASAQAGLRPGESVRETDAIFPGAEPLDEDGEPLVWAVRIVSDVTGRPIPNAVVRVPNHVAGGAAPADIFYRCEARADADGWARVAREDFEGWRDYIIAEADGYAASEHCTPFEEECRLMPGTDVPMVLLDYLGTPVAGARIGLNLGCGHIPDQRQALTDSAGRAVLRCILPSRHNDIFIEAPGLHAGAARLASTWRPEGPPVEIHA